jgi:hypothetical protein
VCPCIVGQQRVIQSVRCPDERIVLYLFESVHRDSPFR